MDVAACDWSLDVGASEFVTLDELPPGRRARVLAVTGLAHGRRRLLEMGLCRGTTVEMVRRAPLGDPLELRVRGYLLSLRAEQARLIEIAAIHGP